MKQCENIPNSNKRNVARTVCDTVVDSHEVEVGFELKLILMLIIMLMMIIGMLIPMIMQDCTETITEVCEQTNTYSHTSVFFKIAAFYGTMNLPKNFKKRISSNCDISSFQGKRVGVSVL